MRHREKRGKTQKKREGKEREEERRERKKPLKRKQQLLHEELNNHLSEQLHLFQLVCCAQFSIYSCNICWERGEEREEGEGRRIRN